MAITNLTDIGSLTTEQIVFLLDRAQFYADRLNNGDPIHRCLEGKIILNMFFENSTRTRTSFEMAAKKLGADVINWDVNASSLKKGETFLDTVQTFAAMKPDGVVIRHSDYNAPAAIVPHVAFPIINAGDSWRAHPSQALLDALTIRQMCGKLDGLKVAICGDIAHSRVAGSNIELLSRFNLDLRLVAPAALQVNPEKELPKNVTAYDNFEEGIAGADIIMMLRIQKERMESGMIPSAEEYFRDWGLTTEKLDAANPKAYVLHPGPMNRNVEIADSVADDPARSLIRKQGFNGIPTRMAILYLTVGRA